ncbi:MAG: hypothetical protein FJ096_07500 [Deltaproteobacteria bacterium]|nr:hypothetical protein [Deltaproteobacteria bacterium]
MKRRIVKVLLLLGVVGGFGMELRHARRAHHGGHGPCPCERPCDTKG